MTQSDKYFRPPSEAESFIVRVMQGCPHNACTFCNLFKGIPCKVLPLAEVIQGLDDDAQSLGPKFIPMVQSMYLEGGDPLALNTAHLLAIMEYATKLFPALDRFACYATARFTLKKSPQDLAALAKAGLRRVFVGLESGSDAILQAARKGCTSADILQTGKMLADAGIEMDVSIMLGIGGKKYSSEHAKMTAEILNKLQPACVRIRTFVPKAGTDLGADYLNGTFTLLSPHEILHELYHLVELVTEKNRLLSEHWSDFVLFDASMPDTRELVLELIRQHLAMPESSFRTVGIAEGRA